MFLYVLFHGSLLITWFQSSSTTTSSTSAPTPTGAPFCKNPVLSCHNTTAVEDLCCFEAPGGQFLLTQFWDTAPSTGPNNSWTLHGLWPDHCDGTYDQFCDPAREYTNITAILKSYSETDLLSYMDTYWKDYQGNDEEFWEHEWNKHGTCMTTLRPSCYVGYTSQAEVKDYFEIAVRLFKTLDSYAVGIPTMISKSPADVDSSLPLTASFHRRLSPTHPIRSKLLSPQLMAIQSLSNVTKQVNLMRSGTT